MGKTNVTKVNATGSTAKKDEKEKGRKDFPIKDALYTDADGNNVKAVNGDDLLVAVPKPIKDDSGKVIYSGFNPRKHLPLKKSDFASMTSYIRYQAYISRIKAQALVKSAEEKEKKANRIEKFGDEATRKKAQRVARMRENLKKLEEGLVAEGIDISEL